MARDDGGQRVDLYRIQYECRARWRHVDDLAVDYVWLSVGELADGRWYVDIYGDITQRCRAYPDKQAAWDVARRWMTGRGGRWERIPCYPTTSRS